MASFPVINGVTTFLAPPEGYEVDFVNPQSRHVLDQYLIFALLGPFAFFCLVQRIYTKHFIVGGSKIDDWSISNGGLCHHVWEMPIEVFEKHMLSSYIAAPLFIICNGLSKMSLLSFYLRISSQPAFRRAIWAAIAMVICYTVVIACLLLFGCRPIRANWDPKLLIAGTSDKCVDSASIYIAIAVANIVSDVVLFIIPIPTVVRLKMPLAQKLGAVLIFAVGSLTVATSIIRMAYLPSLLSTSDIPWVAAPANVWVFAEANLFIVCVSMTTFRKFFQRFAPKWLGLGSMIDDASNPSKSTTYNKSASRISRQNRTGYSQFDSVEIENKPSKDDHPIELRLMPVGGVVEGTTTTVVGSEVEEAGTLPRDDSSDQEILNNNANQGEIMYTKTFEIRYSK
ncbi:unnamed protein product [Clonostachys rhizophaga]|uniref:Rhodopsin domain-containing protein n=1 Tax=Clonostachys rhizophaga TaxID=160324 RepID=A0A9N9VNK3_9HYPO|nr:unnamed protein product [Clonostachys rhizophaga]